MVVNAVQNNQSQQASAADTAAKKSMVDYNTFLKLLVAQMKNQDPTNPMDSSEQISQLATFSQVEQTIKVNKNLEQMLQGSKFSQASLLIGKTITSSDGKISGVVKEVSVLSTGLKAILANGKNLDINDGIKVR